MGAADLRDAFNAGAAGEATCQKATLGYESHSGVQYQRLTFSGTDRAGGPFEVRSDLLRPDTDVNLVATEMGAAMRPKDIPAPQHPAEAGL